MNAVTGVEKILTGYKGLTPSNIIMTTCGNQWTARTYTTTNPGFPPRGIPVYRHSVDCHRTYRNVRFALETGKTTKPNIVSGGANRDGNVTGVPIVIGTNSPYCVQVSTRTHRTLCGTSLTACGRDGNMPCGVGLTGVGTIPTGTAANTPLLLLSSVTPSADNTVIVNWAQLSRPQVTL